LLVVVELSNSVFGFSRFHLVPVTAIVRSMVEGITAVESTELPDFFHHFGLTLREVVTAYVLAIVIGVGLGVVFGYWKPVGDAFEPLLLAWWSLPWIIAFPVIVLALGIGSITRISVGFLLGFTYILFNTSTGLRAADRRYMLLARSVGLGRWRTFVRVVFPSAFPAIVTGLRLGLAGCYIGVVVSGILLGNEGLGYILEWTSRRLFTPQLLGTVTIVILLGVAFDTSLRTIESRVMRAWSDGGAR
jgi:ABC-type nitrate/sulfonate/bicarbonate transport system permease component